MPGHTIVGVLRALLREEAGQGMTEYAVLVGSTALGVILVLLAIGDRIIAVVGAMRTELQDVPTS